ncbi:hypothetical protein K474DRAFT_1510690 [Panus rudis PR-1116 ss-1]|nr:hypothetical protein K474DRAFT_1510690 [Panus rudis PR-1116 ss-1]
MPLTVTYLMHHPQDFIGPNVMNVLVQAVETGIILNQAFTFLSRAERENWVIRVMALFVTSVAMFQSSLAFYNLWRGHVIHFADWVAATEFIWIDKISPALTASMASPVQAFLIYRCWHLTKQSWFTLAPLGAVLITNIVASIVVTVGTFKIDFHLLVENIDKIPKIQTDPIFILTLCSSAVLDVAVTSILLIYLSRARANVYSSRFRRVMRKLVALIWEAAVPPCLCAITVVVTYLTVVNMNYWDLMFQAILGKLYVISFFTTVNGRADLVRVAHGTNQNRLTSLAWARSRPVTLTMSVSELTIFPSLLTLPKASLALY